MFAPFLWFVHWSTLPLILSLFIRCLFLLAPSPLISLLPPLSNSPTLFLHIFHPQTVWLKYYVLSVSLSFFVIFFLRLPQKNSNVSFHTKVNVRFDLVCHVRTKTSPHNAVPVRSVLLIKVCSYLSSCFFVGSAGDTVTGRWKCILCCFNRFVHHFISHVFRVHNGFFRHGCALQEWREERLFWECFLFRCRFRLLLWFQNYWQIWWELFYLIFKGEFG